MTARTSSRRFCNSNVHRQRRIQRLLDEALAELYPAEPPDPPSTFELTEAELRREARRLYRAGWSAAEITAVIAIEPLERP